MSARPSLIVALVHMDDQVAAAWLPNVLLQRLDEELCQGIATVLNTDLSSVQLINSSIGAMYIKSTQAMVSLAAFLHGNGVQTVVTIGDKSVLDENDTEKMLCSNQCDLKVECGLIEPENLENATLVNVWVSKELPMKMKEEWAVVDIRTLEGRTLNNLLMQEAAPKEEVKEQLTAESEPFIEEVNQEQEFLTALRKQRLLISTQVPTSVYEVDELLAKIFKETYRLFRSTAKKLAELIPHMKSGSFVNINPLEQVLASVWVSDVEIGLLPAAQATSAVSRDVSVLLGSYNQMYDALKLGLEALEPTFVQYSSGLPSPPAVSLELLPGAEGSFSIILANRSVAPASDLTVLFLAADGSQLQHENFTVSPNASLNCVAAEYVQWYKERGVTKVQLQGTDQVVNLP